MLQSDNVILYVVGCFEDRFTVLDPCPSLDSLRSLPLVSAFSVPYFPSYLGTSFVTKTFLIRNQSFSGVIRCNKTKYLNF